MAPPPLPIVVHPSSGIPIYRQIVEQVQAQVAGGRLEEGQMLPSVRQVAADLSVNPMTVSKAYSLLELSGTVERLRGTGMRIAPGPGRSTIRQRQQQLGDLADQFVQRARQLQLDERQALAAVRAAWRRAPRPAETVTSITKEVHHE